MPCKCGSRTHARTSHHLCPLRRNQGGPALTGDARDFNPLSKWEEHVLVPGLTLWQLNRPTWALVTEDTGDEDKARADIGLAGSAESAGSAKSTGSARSARSAGLGRGGGEGHLHMHLQHLLINSVFVVVRSAVTPDMNPGYSICVLLN